MRDAVLGSVLDRDLRGREKAREVDEELSRHDDGAVALDLGRERRPQRELHVGGRDLQAIALGPEEHAGQHLHRAASGDDARDGRERRDELISITRDLEARSDRYVYFTNHLKNLLS